jgi:hypothetical protein
MKSLRTSLQSQLLFAGLLFGAAASSALAGSLSSSYGTSVGNSNIGSTSNYSLAGANSATSSSLTGSATSSVTLLGASKPLETFSFTTKVTGGVASNNASLVVGTFIVFSQTSSTTTTWNKSTAQTFVTSNSTVNVPTAAGAVPVTVNGTLSGTGTINLTASVTPSANSVGLTGGVGTNVGGTATASVAAKYKETATVVSNLQMGNATLNASAISDTTKTMTGTFTLSLDAANLAFIVQLNALTSTALAGSTSLGSYVLPARVFTLLTL